jgi:putative ATP-binding cassette transporter
MDHWLDDHVYYQLEIVQRGTDNPDQRIAEDLRMFAFTTLDLAFGLLSSAVTLVSFIGILWVISGPIDVNIGELSFQIPGFMVWVAILYAVVGSVLTHVVGRPLIGLNFQQQRVEADLRFGLIRLRENSEGVALYGGEDTERVAVESRIERIRQNWWQLMRYTKNLTFLTTGYGQLADIFPLLVAAPRYFSGAISLGVLTQIGNAFGQVQGALSWFVDSYGSLASWKATVDRLLTFQDAMALARRQATRQAGISVVANGVSGIHADGLELALPDGSVLLPEMNLAIERGDTLLITGPTGAGKSTLFRALAGIWPFGTGAVHVPAGAHLLFLPQRPYLPIGSLRDVVSYPAGHFEDEQIRCVLTAAGLAPFADRLDEVDNWALQLSGGEQQRLAIVRAILQQPDWLFLDEATAALDETSEAQMYALLRMRLPNTAIVSIAHRPGVAPFHARHLALAAPQTTNGGTDLPLALAT